MNLWRDELEELYRIFMEVYPDAELEIDDAMADSIADLAEIESVRIFNFKMTSKDDRAVLTLSKLDCSIRVAEPTLAERGMIGQIERILISHKSPVREVRAVSLVVILITALGVGLLLDNNPVTSPQDPWIGGGLVGIALLFIGAMIGEGSNLFYSPALKMRSRYRSEAPTWLARNRDGLATNAIVSAIFLVIGIGVGYLIPRN